MLPPCKVGRGQLGRGWGGKDQLRGPDTCVVPGKLLWNRDPEESGPALPAAVSIPQAPRLGSGGRGTVQPALGSQPRSQTSPSVFCPGTMPCTTPGTGSGSWMPTTMGPAAPSAFLSPPRTLPGECPHLLPAPHHAREPPRAPAGAHAALTRASFST